MGVNDGVGRLYVGTSGYAYRGWIPRFYEPGKASRRLLEAYARRLPAVEINNTFYRRPEPQLVEAWLRQTPDTFRFCPKAQRGTAWRAWSQQDPSDSFAWLTSSFEAFEERLGCVLLSAHGSLQRDDAALARVLAAWPEDMALAVQLPHPSWDADEVRRRVAEAGAAVVVHDWNDRPEPSLGGPGRFIYLRLRRFAYEPADLERWAGRLAQLLLDGTDVFAFFRHDEDGQMALHAEALLALVDEIVDARGEGRRMEAHPRSTDIRRAKEAP